MPLLAMLYRSNSTKMPDEAMQNYKHRLYEQFARIGKALGNAHRLEIVDLLAQTDHSVDSLARKTGMSIASVSQHLQILRGAQLVAVRREGTYAYYRLADENVLRVWLAISQLAQVHLAEIDKLTRDFFKDRPALEAISADELLKRLEDVTLTLIDARPQDEYQAGHIPGAISLPMEAFETGLDRLILENEIVVYCRSAYCLLSDEVALALYQRGFAVRVLEEGMLEWQHSGFPIVKPGNEDAG